MEEHNNQRANSVNEIKGQFSGTLNPPSLRTEIFTRANPVRPPYPAEGGIPVVGSWSGQSNGSTVVMGGGLFAGHVIAGATITIAGTGTEYIVVKPVYTLTVAFDFVYTNVWASGALDVAASGSETVVLSTTGSDFSIPVLQLVNGVITIRYYTIPIGAYVRDDGSGTAQAQLVVA